MTDKPRLIPLAAAELAELLAHEDLGTPFIFTDNGTHYAEAEPLRKWRAFRDASVPAKDCGAK